MSKLDLEVDLCGVHFKNPLLLSAGPPTANAKKIIEAYRQGWAGAVTKTLRLEAAVNPYPHIAAINRKNLLNAEKWSDLTYQQWIEKEIPAIKKEGIPVIVSVGHTLEEVEKIVPLVEEAGADIIELVSYEQEGFDEMVKIAKELVSVPVLAKISPNWSDPVGISLKCEKLGADGITAIDSFGPVLSIDVETGKPFLGSVKGEGWLSGFSIKPLAVYYVAGLASKLKIPVIGVGGIFSGKDVIEMIMAGATCVQVCTAAILEGIGLHKKLIQQISDFMNTHGYDKLEEIRGIALKEISKLTEEKKDKLHPVISEEKCTLCGLCVRSCPYGALTMGDRKVLLEIDMCQSCGLCYSVCPFNAITLQKR
jgi:dihydroorotate dehydrogenase subfamily 1